MALSVETLALARKSSKKYTDSVFQSFSNGLTYKGGVYDYSDLPNNASVGDVYTVINSGYNYAWGNVEGVP
jgi:hypothetical protein